MASPQLKDGFTRIANELIEAPMRTNLSAYQSRILWAIWRETYGWNKTQGYISNRRLSELTGLRKSHISRTVKELVERNMVTRIGNKISFNKDYQGWRELPKRVTVTNRGNRVTDAGYRTLPIRVTASRVKALQTVIDKGLKKGKKSKEKKVLPDSRTSESFDFFYAAYPKREAKQSALEAWNKLNPNSSLCKEIMVALEKQKHSEQWQTGNGKYIPLPASWLNGRRWEDEIPDIDLQTTPEDYFTNKEDIP